MAYRCEFEGLDELGRALYEKSNANWANVINDNLDQMVGRAKANGGTPYLKGGLTRSICTLVANESGYSGSFGYSSEYAAHVELGHRVVIHGKDAGYVQGQHFLQKNLDAQSPIFIRDLMNQLKE